VPNINDQVAAAFYELADLLEITGGDRFRILAYRRVGNMIGGLAKPIASYSDKELATLQGVGKATAEKIHEFLKTGTMRKLDEARAEVPPGLREMTQLSGLGPKKALLIYQELGVSTLDALREAIRKQRLRGIKGLGPKTEENLMRALKRHASEPQRFLLETALVAAEEMAGGLRATKGVRKAAYAGSLRRMKETIGDLDLLATAKDHEVVMDAFVSLGNVERVAARGPTKSTVVTREGMQVDLRVVAPDEWGAAMQYFTGSKEHNVKVREHAVKMGFKLSEYGLFKVKGGERVAAETEEEVYSALGMQTPPATLRENRGEVELALRGELPKVVTLKDVKGDLHTHSTYSDGSASIKEMAEAAAALGRSYFAITDHGRNLHLRSLSIDDISRQSKEIAKLNDSLGGKVTVLHGVELNIGRDGELDYPAEILARFDVVVASVHHELEMERGAMTRRIVNALRSPYVNVLGHPTCRRLGKRPPIDADLEAVFQAAADNQVALEISGHPERLDLKDDHIMLAKEIGCVFSIDTDSHSPASLGRMRLGVSMAQRGWVTAEEVINTRPLGQLQKFVRDKR
jgi:DNA polymerase (family 10)